MAQIDYIFDNLPKRAFTKDENSNLYKFLNAFGKEMDLVTDKMEELRKTKFVETAKGKDLDKLASLLNLKRFPAESDEGFRARVKTRVQTFIGGGTIEALRQIIRLALNVEPTVIEHYKTKHNHLVFNNGIFNGCDVIKTTGLGIKVNDGIGYVEGNKFNINNEGNIKNIVKANFNGKIAGSIVENGNIGKYVHRSTLNVPSGTWNEMAGTSSYDRLVSLNGITSFLSNPNEGNISQQLFSFDIIRVLEDKFGSWIWEGKTLLADKIIIAKQVLKKLTANWHGFGSGPLGNKSFLEVWYPNSNKWQSQMGYGSSINNSPNVLKVSLPLNIITDKIDSNGFVHFLAYAEPAGKQNLVPPWDNWTVKGSAYTKISDYKVQTNPIGQYHEAYVDIPVQANMKYTASLKTSHGDLRGIMFFLASDRTTVIGSATASYTDKLVVTTPPNCAFIRYRLSNWSVVEGTFEDMSLVLGDNPPKIDIVPSVINTDYVELELEVDIPNKNNFTLESNKSTNILVTKYGSIIATPRNNMPDEAILATVQTDSSNVTNIIDKRYKLNPFEDAITNTASVTLQIPYNFTESNITLENVKDILKSTKAAGIALLIKLIETQEDTINISDNVDFTFEMGFSGLGGENYIGGR